MDDRDKLNHDTLVQLKKEYPDAIDWNMEDNQVTIFDGNDRILDTISLDNFEEKFCPDCINYKGNN